MDLIKLSAYLRELADNNAKPWFEANRPRYDALRGEFTDIVDEIIFGLAAFDPRIQGLQAKDCLYRIYRDVRFSKEKTPYKTTFSAAFPRNMVGAGYYFQVNEEGKLMVAGGYYMPDNDTLARIRNYIAQRPERLETLLDNPYFRTALDDAEAPRLQRPPRGFDDTTPLIQYIKLKSFTVGQEYPVRDLDGDTVAPFVVDKFRAMSPLIVWLREALGQPEG